MSHMWEHAMVSSDYGAIDAFVGGWIGEGDNETIKKN